jgi:hypothetical protein
MTALSVLTLLLSGCTSTGSEDEAFSVTSHTLQPAAVDGNPDRGIVLALEFRVSHSMFLNVVNEGGSHVASATLVTPAQGDIRIPLNSLTGLPDDGSSLTLRVLATRPDASSPTFDRPLTFPPPNVVFEDRPRFVVDGHRVEGVHVNVSNDGGLPVHVASATLNLSSPVEMGPDYWVWPGHTHHVWYDSRSTPVAAHRSNVTFTFNFGNESSESHVLSLEAAPPDVSFSGTPQLDVVNGRIESVRVSLRNSGDVPAHVESVTWQVEGATFHAQDGPDVVPAREVMVFRATAGHAAHPIPGEFAFTLTVAFHDAPSLYWNHSFTRGVEDLRVQLEWNAHGVQALNVTGRAIGDYPLDLSRAAWGFSEEMTVGARGVNAERSASGTGVIPASPEGRAFQLVFEAGTTVRPSHASDTDFTVTFMDAEERVVADASRAYAPATLTLNDFKASVTCDETGCRIWHVGFEPACGEGVLPGVWSYVELEVQDRTGATPNGWYAACEDPAHAYLDFVPFNGRIPNLDGLQPGEWPVTVRLVALDGSVLHEETRDVVI